MRRTSVLRGSAPLGDDHFEIFARDDQRAVIGDVEIVDQRVEIRLERLAGRRVDRRERLENRAVLGAEDLDPMLGRSVTEDKKLALRRDDRLRTEQDLQIGLAAPQRRRLHARRRRNVFADGLEQPADEALRRPIGHADLAAGTADAHELPRRLLLFGSEHDTEGREHDIEAGVRKGQIFRVGFLEGDGQALRFGAHPAAFEQRADVVRRHDVSEAAGRGQRRVAVAGGDVEDALVAADIDGLAQHLADDLQGGADDGVVAGGPGAVLAGLDRGEIDGGGDGNLGVHGCVPCERSVKLAAAAGLHLFGHPLSRQR
jgi:hypothetical protein